MTKIELIGQVSVYADLVVDLLKLVHRMELLDLVLYDEPQACGTISTSDSIFRAVVLVI